MTLRPYQQRCSDAAILTRKEAKALGLTRYFTGKPCIRGHIAERWSAGGMCTSCHYEKYPVQGFYGKSKEHKKELQRLRGRRWYEKNRSEVIEKAAQWKKENPEKINLSMRRWRKKETSKAIIFMRQCVRRCMKNKTDRTHVILGYTKEELMSHLERQFKKGMTWGNMGEWHIDHIIPVSQYVAEGETDPSVINALTNLRPMWAQENMKKHNRRDMLI